MSVRTCSARGCISLIPRTLLMCKLHWGMVPPPLRDAIWHYYRQGQTNGARHPSRQYAAVVRRAVDAVWNKESRASERAGHFGLYGGKDHA